MTSKSVFAKLIGIFFIAGILLVVSITLPFKFMSDGAGKAFFLSNILEYTNLVVNEYERNPNYGGALYKNTKLQIERVKKENAEKILKTKFKGIELKSVSKDLRFSKSFHRSLIVFEKNGFSYFIDNEKEQQDNHGIILFVTGILCLGVLLGTYKFVSKLFSPLKEIQYGVDQYSKGNLKHQIKIKGDVQFLHLANRLNTMSCEINNKLEERNALLMAIAHEIKTPLASARINAELIENSPENEKVKDEIREIDRIVSTIVEVNRELNGGIHSIEKINVKSFFSVIDGINLIAHVEEFEANQDKLHIVLINLIENAKKYGSEKVVVEVFENEISVRDFGPGISADVMLNLTKPFFRESSARTRGGGYGLGLYLVEKLTQSQGMLLSFQNEAPGLLVKITRRES